MKLPWTPADETILLEIARKSTEVAEACAEFARRTGRPLTRHAADDYLRRKHGTTLARIMHEAARARAAASVASEPEIEVSYEDEETPADVYDADREQTDPSIAPAAIGSDFRVVDLADAGEEASAGVEAGHAELSKLAALAKKWSKKGGLTLEALCDAFGIPPQRGRALAERAIQAGYAVDMRDGVLDFRPHERADHKEVVVESPHVALGDEICVGVVSDPHFASKHHERDAVKRHVEWLYENGVRHIFGPGDWVAGGYRFLKYEVTHTGIEDQCELAVDFVKECGPELTWHTIAGNHDESHDVGINAAKMIEQRLRALGFNNFHYYGPRAALIRLYDTRFAMHHPGGGLSYAISYKMQKYVDEQPPHRRAQFLFTGHTHQALYMERGGCHSFLCGTFENGDSSFGRMLGGDVKVGGWLVKYRLDERGQVGELDIKFKKQPHRSMQFVQVPAALDTQR